MFRAKQVQTLDVSKVMDQILENHDAKVAVDKLAEFLDKKLDESLAQRNDDEEIKKDAERGYSWSYKEIFYGIDISGEKLADLIGYKIRPEDEGTFQIIQDKFKQFKQDIAKKPGGEDEVE